MLAEGFLRVLLYREERKLASASRRSQSHAKDAPDCNVSTTDSSEAGREPWKNAVKCYLKSASFANTFTLCVQVPAKRLVRSRGQMWSP